MAFFGTVDNSLYVRWALSSASMCSSWSSITWRQEVRTKLTAYSYLWPLPFCALPPWYQEDIMTCMCITITSSSPHKFSVFYLNSFVICHNGRLGPKTHLCWSISFVKMWSALLMALGHTHISSWCLWIQFCQRSFCIRCSAGKLWCAMEAWWFCLLFNWLQTKSTLVSCSGRMVWQTNV